MNIQRYFSTPVIALTFLLCLFSVSFSAFAAQVNLLASTQKTASGSGVSGIPSITNFTIPAGKNRVLVVWNATERDHCANTTECASTNSSGTGLGDNWNIPSHTNPILLTAQLSGSAGNVTNTPTSTQDMAGVMFGVAPTGVTDIWALSYSASFVPFYFYEADIQQVLGGASSGTVNITLTDTVAPKSAGDDAILMAMVFENVEQIKTSSSIPTPNPGVVRNSYIRNSATSVPSIPGNSSPGSITFHTGQAMDEATDGYLLFGYNTSTEGFLTPSGFNSVISASTTNTGGVFAANSGKTVNEPNGISANAYFRNGIVASGFSLTAAGSSSTNIYAVVADGFLLESDSVDSSDAPASYGVATHNISGIRLGASVDNNDANLSSPDALGDDNNGTDDENGVTLPASIMQGSSATATVNIQSASGYLNAWVDWNKDGDFLDSGEQVATDQAVNVGNTNLTLAAPVSAVSGTTFARFRVCSTTNTCKTTDGNAASGEVEDYAITITASFSISGVVFEDINYGGGAGRSQTTASGLGTNGAKVELYNSTGSLVATTTTANDGTKDGAYSFGGLVAGNYYVRVVSDTVNSTRTGTNGTELAVQTFRTDGTTAVTNEVGGHAPTLADGIANTGTETLNTTTYTLSGGGNVQSLQPVTISSSTVTGVSFGFNFDTVVNTNDAGQGSLRQFILNSNLLKNTGLAQSGLTAGYETSIFQLTGTAPFTITPTSALPAITDSYTAVDATTQAGTSCLAGGRTLVVQLDGSTSGSNMQGITTNADHTLIRGLAIGNYSESGIYASATGTNLTVKCNNLGVKADGVTLMKNTFYGIYDNGGANLTLGGTSTSDRNIISGNGKDGARLNGVNTALIQNNYVGTTANGLAALSNNQEIADYAGIMLTGATVATGSKTITITDNVVSGNDKGVANTSNTTKGIKAFNASFLTITNNRIGTTPDGMTALLNTGYGVYTQSATDIMIGGTTAAERNIISGNQQDGINTRFGTNRINIYGNYIGLGSDGVKAIGNANNGIFLTDTANALIGNGAASGRNIIGNNTLSGIRNSTSDGTKIADNYIGTDVSGTLDKGNTLHGVYVHNSNNVVVGGSNSTDANLIVYNKIIGLFTERTLVSTVNTNTLVENNYIGILKDGETLAGNTQSGVETKYNTGVTVRNNTISGNKTRGINVFSSPSTTITNNRIGTNASGTSDKGNNQYGIDISPAAANLTINGNTVSGNDMAGIRLISGDGTGSAIYDNRIGTNLAGTAAIANTLDGILIDGTPNVLIGSTSGAANTISGNARNGILINGAAAQSIQVLGNVIGLNSAATSGIANAGQGILVQTSASNISIGNGTSAGSNKIAYNGDNGISLNGTTPNNVTISNNSIYANQVLGIDLGLDKVSLDDANDADTGANSLLNFPMFKATQMAGTNLIISGCAPTGAKIELFEADVSPTSASAQATGANKTTLTQDYGEGERYLQTLTEGTGEDTTTTPIDCSTFTDADGNSATGMSPFQWTIATPANIALGDKLTGTATLASTGTSEFSAITLVSTGKKLSGVVFEDINYGGGAGRSQATASGVGVNGATVELYDSTGALVATTTTANDGTKDGAYSFSSVSAGNYYVRVVNDTVNSTRTGTNGTELAVQTFRTDGTTVIINEVGGHSPTLIDGVANTGTETLNIATYKLSGGGNVQSLQPVTIASADLMGVDFGFNFDTIVNTNDAGQGSLRQFIINSNLLANTGLAQALPSAVSGDYASGDEVSIFMISKANLNGAGGNANTAFIQFTSDLPAITDVATKIDGRTQTANIDDSNAGQVGTGGTVGTDNIPLSMVNRPEVTLDMQEVSQFQFSANQGVVRGITAYDCPTGDYNGCIISDNGANGTTIEHNIIGAYADGSRPIVADLADADGVALSGQGTLRNNYFAFNGKYHFIIGRGDGQPESADNSVVENNEAYQLVQSVFHADASAVYANKVTVQGNFIHGMESNGVVSSFSGGKGIEIWYDTDDTIIRNNTITGMLSTGILTGDNSTGLVIEHNKIYSNGGSAVVLHDTAAGKFSQNSFWDNHLGIDLVQSATVSFGDEVTLNDANDGDTGGNSLLNFPMLASATIAGGNLTLKGCAPTGSTIELFEADVSPSSTSGIAAGANQFGKTQDYGEGERYLQTFTEGVGEDTVTTPIACSTLADADGNNQTGLSPFQWTIAMPPSVVLGDKLTATATITNTKTSEFSPVTIIKAFDFSDAPASYGTPSHVVDTNIYMGPNPPDTEGNALPSVGADGDDSTGTLDEDGIASVPTLSTTDTSASVLVQVHNKIPSLANLVGWLDWNHNGQFDTNEAVNMPIGSMTEKSVGLTWKGISGLQAGTTYLRLRLTTDTAIATGTASTSLPTGFASDGEVEDYAITVTDGGYNVSGQVFLDANVNAANDSGEVGIKDVTVVLYDTVGNTCRAVRTNAQGQYSFSQVANGTYHLYEAGNAAISPSMTCPPAANDLSGYSSSTANQLNITVNNAALTQQNFGDVKVPSFTLDHEKVILPNSTIAYPHVFQVYVDGSVDFSIADTQADPANLTWGEQILLDANCDGKLDSGDSSLTTPLAVNAGDKVCILVKVAAPSNASTGALLNLTVQSEFTYGDGSLGLAPNVQTHTDITSTSAGTPESPVEGSGKLQLDKAVWNVTRNIDGNVAKPGETLQYTLHYQNIGNGTLNTLVLHDRVPEFTDLVPNSLTCVDTPPELTSCTPSVTGTGLTLQWDFTGTLPAGAEGTVSYQVMVQ